MLSIDQKQRQIIRRCQGSPQYFISELCWVKHPKLGPIKFKLFPYQSDCLLQFMDNRFIIFWKTRQAGISTIVGAYALWYAMFGVAKTVLIVSKRDKDAKDFLNKNVKFVYNELPDWMRALWPFATDNEHEVAFPNGSIVTSLSSSKDTLRSNSASLVILDEVAHMPNMSEMWQAGSPTLQHAGQCICIATPNGIGNWYWQTVTDAQENQNDFKLVKINWWDMNWRLDHVDKLTGIRTTIAPTEGIRETVNEEERKKYGKYWSPWLEGQYRQLTQRGDPRKFRQEVLAEFLGSGNTVVSNETLSEIAQQYSSDYFTVGNVDYANPFTDERAVLEFNDNLWIWKKPIRNLPTGINQLPQPDGIYVMGVDTGTGDGTDYSTVEVFDTVAREQVAELRIKTLPRTFARMADYIGRYYNNALAVVETTGIGKATVQEMGDILSYPNLYRQKNSRNTVGFSTQGGTKPFINKAIIDNFGKDGFIVYSYRLYKELCIYIHMAGGKTGNEPGIGNTDDLVIASGLALVALNDAIVSNSRGILMPFRPSDPQMAPFKGGSKIDQDDRRRMDDLVMKGGLVPMSMGIDYQPEEAGNELAKVTAQIGGLPADGKIGCSVVQRRHVITHRKR